MKSAFTLVELITIVIIIGILAALCLPLLSKAVEGTRAKEAIAGLQQIRTGERVYRTEENTYFYSTASAAKEKIKEINNKLSLYLDAGEKRNWDYKIEVGERLRHTFDATATRRGGAYNGRTITLDEGGPPFGGTWPLPLP